jgi:hypothetical protein
MAEIYLAPTLYDLDLFEHITYSLRSEISVGDFVLNY